MPRLSPRVQEEPHDTGSTAAATDTPTRPATRAYAARLTTAGKTEQDILRCLKRAIARQVFHLLTNPPSVEHSEPQIVKKRQRRLNQALRGGAPACCPRRG